VSRKVFNSKTRLDILGDFRNFEVLSTDYKLLMNFPSESTDKTPNERICRYIIEVTKENMDYCKAMMKKSELRHLDNLKLNFIIHENQYYFISTNIEYNPDVDKEDEFDKNVDVSIIHNSTSEIVKYQEKIFDILWQNSMPADEKIRELEKEKEKINNVRCCDLEKKSLDAVTPFNKEDNSNIVQITRDNERIKSLLISGILDAKSEILLTIGLLHHLRYFWKIGIPEGLKHAIEKGVRIIILYPEAGNSDITRKDVTNLVSTTEENVHLSGVSGPIGSVMIVDNAKIILIDNEKENKSTNDNILGVYSNNKSVVSNFGSLFDTLLNEKEVLNYAVDTKIQLESSNKQLKESNQRLKKYTEIQQEFINLAAHELRTPTQAILGYLELLETSDINDVSNRKYLKVIERNANRLRILIEDLLDVSRIESNNIILHKERTNLKNLIDLVIKDFEIDLQKRREDSKKKGDDSFLKNIEICSSWNVDENQNVPSILDVMIDRSKIIQVLSNLINNSLNSIYNDKGNSNLDGNNVRIMITKIMNKEVAESDGNNNHPDLRKNDVLITIKDTGKGIDPELFPRLFEKFATNSSFGTGLGLYISKAIIEAHRGRIWAKNSTNEKGAMFSFTLPTV
jgi:signal transduction histidine kinase